MEVTFSDGTREHYEDQPFAKGAQGSIYRSQDKRFVVKLLEPRACTPERQRQLDAIIGQYNVVQNSPYWDELFTWPQKRAVSPSMGVRTRYVTGLTRLDYYFFPGSFQRLPPEQKGWWIGRVAVAIKLARAVERLSNAGLCHSDLSEKNVMVDSFDGRMVILDCDSLVVPGVLPAEVLGTPEYMAPELASRKTLEPSVVTDRHALAVLLYRWLLYRHPLIGPKKHSPDSSLDDQLALGERALFIEHPTDFSNRPRNLQLTTDILTPRLRELFRLAFVDALHTPTKRPLPNAWEEALVELFDHIIPCSNTSGCEQRFFVAPEAGPLRCPLCKTYVDFPAQIPYLKLRSPRHIRGAYQYEDEGLFPRYVVGWAERPLYLWHANPAVKAAPGPLGQPPDSRPCAFIRFDASQRVWYLDNLALPQLQISNDGGATWAPVQVGTRAPLMNNGRLLFGPLNLARMAFIEMRRVQ